MRNSDTQGLSRLTERTPRELLTLLIRHRRGECTAQEVESASKTIDQHTFGDPPKKEIRARIQGIADKLYIHSHERVADKLNGAVSRWFDQERAALMPKEEAVRLLTAITIY
jgi:hypothetical protein